jgi:hypothetical protein
VVGTRPGCADGAGRGRLARQTDLDAVGSGRAGDRISGWGADLLGGTWKSNVDRTVGRVPL